MSLFTRSGFRLLGDIRTGATVHVVQTMDIFVKFEVWNLNTKAFEPIANMPVDLIDNDPMSNDLIDTKTTDANGLINFQETEQDFKQKSGEDKPDLFFLARSKGQNIGGVALPESWSTKEWKDKNGKSGFFPDTPFVAGSSLAGATAADPLVYRIGIDYHARVEFVGPTDATHNRGPKGLEVGIGPLIIERTQRTDAVGEFHGLIFDIQPDKEVFFQIKFNIEDASINLPRSRIAGSDEASWSRVDNWRSDTGDADKKTFPNNRDTSLGTQTSPVVLAVSAEKRNVGLFFLTMLYEHTAFFFHITGGAWNGVANLEMFLSSASGTAYSWPIGSVNVPSSDYGARDTLIHELSHQVMWKEVGIGSWGILGQIASPSGLCLTHYINMLATPTHAVIEGWAEIFEGIFEPSSMTFSSSSSVTTKTTPVSLGPPPVNQGESVEGAFAKGILNVFHDFVVGSASSSSTVTRSFNGDVSVSSPWITNADVKRRFKSIIWDPLHALSSSSPTTTDFLANIKSGNAADWPDIAGVLNKLNLALELPAITAIAPASGSKAGGQTVTITGTGFLAGSVNVRIGGQPVTGTTVVNARTITCTTPAGAPGKVDVFVSNAVGPATLPTSYQYTDP